MIFPFIQGSAFIDTSFYDVSSGGETGVKVAAAKPVAPVVARIVVKAVVANFAVMDTAVAASKPVAPVATRIVGEVGEIAGANLVGSAALVVAVARIVATAVLAEPNPAVLAAAVDIVVAT